MISWKCCLALQWWSVRFYARPHGGNVRCAATSSDPPQSLPHEEHGTCPPPHPTHADRQPGCPPRRAPIMHQWLRAKFPLAAALLLQLLPAAAAAAVKLDFRPWPCAAERNFARGGWRGERLYALHVWSSSPRMKSPFFHLEHPVMV